MTDTIAQLTHLDSAPHAQATRQQRAKAIAATQACEDLLLAPDLPGGLPLAQRLAVAQTVSAASGVTALAEHYGASWPACPRPAQDARWQAMQPLHAAAGHATPRRPTAPRCWRCPPRAWPPQMWCCWRSS